jgi:hypothetical protein
LGRCACMQPALSCRPSRHSYPSTGRTVRDEDTTCSCWLAESSARSGTTRVEGWGAPNTFTQSHTSGEIPSRRSSALLVPLLGKFFGLLQGLMKDQAKLVIASNGSSSW